jgi:hypothetical protein
LEANCSHSFFGYTFLMRLSPEEAIEYQRKGRANLHWLAQEIQASVPILQASQSSYKGRDVSSAYEEKVSVAVEAWRTSK